MGGGVESGVEEMDLPHSCRCFLFFLVGSAASLVLHFLVCRF